MFLLRLLATQCFIQLTARALVSINVLADAFVANIGLVAGFELAADFLGIPRISQLFLHHSPACRVTNSGTVGTACLRTYTFLLPA